VAEMDELKAKVYGFCSEYPVVGFDRDEMVYKM
jgi:hypothetical protein